MRSKTDLLKNRFASEEYRKHKYFPNKSYVSQLTEKRKCINNNGKQNKQIFVIVSTKQNIFAYDCIFCTISI